MFNKFTAIVQGIIGVLAATYIGFYACFCSGLKDIISNATIIDNSIILNEKWLIFGGLKMVVAGIVFTYLLGVTISLFKYYWGSDDDNTGNTANA